MIKIDFLNGHLIYNNLHNINIQKSFNLQADTLTSDLLLVSYENGKYVLDVGWHSAHDVDGEFTIRIIKDSQWSNAYWQKNTKNYAELFLYIQAFAYIIKNMTYMDNNIIVFDKNDKRRLYWLIELYLSKKITLEIFCDEFHICYREFDDASLADYERKAFSELAEIEGRYSQYDEDHKNYPGIHYTTEQLQAKIMETKQKLTAAL